MTEETDIAHIHCTHIQYKIKTLLLGTPRTVLLAVRQSCHGDQEHLLVLVYQLWRQAVCSLSTMNNSL